VAALCLNTDISYIRSVTTYLNQLIRTDDDPSDVYEKVSQHPVTDIYSRIANFAAARNREPRSLTTDDKRELLQELSQDGELDRRGAAVKIASILGVTRTQIYYCLRDKDDSKRKG